MFAAGTPRWSLRLEQVESRRLAWAFAISLALHLLVLGTYELGQRYHWWQNLRWPAWMKPPGLLTQLLKKPEAPPSSLDPMQQVPLMFVDVSPAQAVAAPPKNAKFYSDKNSAAANPDPEKDTEIPRIQGNQEHVVKTEDVPREQPKPLQPAPPVAPAPVAKEEVEEIKAKPAMTPGDLALAKPELVPPKDPGKDNETRPRTLKEAMARKNLTRIPGEKMKQEGGVRRRLQMASLDAKATPFGAYDSALVEAIASRWYGLLDERAYASDSRGKVVLQFNLHFDGRVSDMNVAENNTGEMLGLICQRAVLDPAPFAPWTIEMRRMFGEKRSIQFTFYYN